MSLFSAFFLWNCENNLFFTLKTTHLKHGGGYSNSLQKQKLSIALVYGKVPVSLTDCGHRKSQSPAVQCSYKPVNKDTLCRLPADCQEKIQLVGSQTVISKEGGKHIAWLTHHNLEAEWIPLLPPEERQDQKQRGAEDGGREACAGKRTLGLIETHGRRRIT